MDYAPVTGLRQALQFLRAEAQSGQTDLQEGEEVDGERRPEDENTEYVIEKVIDHGYRDEELILRVKWYGYGTKDATWEPIEQLPRRAVVTYFRRKGWSLPAQVARAQQG